MQFPSPPHPVRVLHTLVCYWQRGCNDSGSKDPVPRIPLNKCRIKWKIKQFHSETGGAHVRALRTSGKTLLKMRRRSQSKVPGREAVLVYTPVSFYIGHAKKSMSLEVFRDPPPHTFKDSDVRLKTILFTFHMLWAAATAVNTWLPFIQLNTTFLQDNTVWHVNLTMLQYFFGVISEDTLGQSLGCFKT